MQMRTPCTYVCIMVCIFYSLLPPYSVESLVILTVNHVPPLHMHSAVECAAVSVSSMDLADNYHHDQQKEGFIASIPVAGINCTLQSCWDSTSVGARTGQRSRKTLRH